MTKELYEVTEIEVIRFSTDEMLALVLSGETDPDEITEH